MDPITTNSVLLLPAILLFFGAFVYGVAFANGIRDHVFPKYRWAGFALVAVSVLIGARQMSYMVDGNSPFYRSLLTSRKVVFAHYIGFLVPLAVLGVMAGLEAWFKSFRRNME